MSPDSVRVSGDVLTAFSTEIFLKMGFPPDDARLSAEIVVWANLRGVDSHGVLRFPWLAGMLEAGQLNPKPQLKTLKETPAVLFLDADLGFGTVVVTEAMNRAMAKAKEVGIGWVLIRNLISPLALGYYSRIAAEAGLAGIVIVCSPPNMVVHGAKAPGVHNSPISIGVPAARHLPIVLDMATSIVAGGKIDYARDKGTPVPEGWGLDKEGTPTTDPNRLKILLPFAGPKGSGLAIMFECLAGLMAGNSLAVPFLQGTDLPRWHRQNAIVAAIDIALFTDVDAYKESASQFIEGIKALPKAEGVEEIFVPGEPEERTCQERTREGIPLPAGTLRNLKDVATRYEVKLPDWL